MNRDEEKKEKPAVPAKDFTLPNRVFFTGEELVIALILPLSLTLF